MDPSVFLHVRLLSQPPLFVRHASAVVVVVVVVVNIFCRFEIASAEYFLFLHAVLKWLQNSSA
jgi:hypothetical protein